MGQHLLLPYLGEQSSSYTSYFVGYRLGTRVFDPLSDLKGTGPLRSFVWLRHQYFPSWNGSWECNCCCWFARRPMQRWWLGSQLSLYIDHPTGLPGSQSEASVWISGCCVETRIHLYICAYVYFRLFRHICKDWTDWNMRWTIEQISRASRLFLDLCLSFTMGQNRFAGTSGLAISRPSQTCLHCLLSRRRCGPCLVQFSTLGNVWSLVSTIHGKWGKMAMASYKKVIFHSLAMENEGKWPCFSRVKHLQMVTFPRLCCTVI